MGNTNGVEVFEGTLLNDPFDTLYNLKYKDKVFISVINGKNGELCFVIPKQIQ